MTYDRRQHTQQTLLTLGDQFLTQYFVSAHRGVKDMIIWPRLFSMGHSLELYAKAVLTDSSGKAPGGHNVPGLLAKIDNSLKLTTAELSAGESLFSPNTVNIDLGVWLSHQEAMELYQAEYFLVDLKYYINKDGNVIYPSVMDPMPVNQRYLKIVKYLRDHIEHKTQHHDLELSSAVESLGFERNPALDVT